MRTSLLAYTFEVSRQQFYWLAFPAMLDNLGFGPVAARCMMAGVVRESLPWGSRGMPWHQGNLVVLS